MIAVLFMRGGSWDRELPLSEQSFFGEHVDFVTGLRECGSIVEVGPLVELAAVADEDPVGLALLDVGSAEAAARLLGDDPMVRGGVLLTRAIPWGDGPLSRAG